MAYIDDIVIATETVEDHMVRLREVFECLREAGFKMRVAKCDFMKSEIKYLGRVVSAEGIKPDPKAVAKLRDWEVPRNKTEMQSFLGLANYYREFIPWHVKLVAPLHAITGLGAPFAWGDEQQQAFNAIKLALIEATALAQPDSEGEFVLDTDASAVAISGILHQWQGPPGERRLRPIVYGSKKLNATQAKYGAPELEMYAAYYFILKNHSYLCSRKFILRVDNQALSWLKTYSTDQALIARWVMALEKYHFKVEHRPRTQHRNADGLSKRTNDYRWREKQLEKLPAVTDKWNFLSQEEFDQLPVAPWFDLHGRVIPNHPQLPAHLRNTKPDPTNAICRVARRRKRRQAAEKRERALRAPLPEALVPTLQTHEDFYPNYPEDWIDVTEEARQDYLLPTHVSNIPSRMTYALDETVEQAMASAPTVVRQAAVAIKDIDTELHEHANTVQGIKDLLLAQNRDVLAIKKLVAQESIDHDIFPEDVRAFARNYYKQKKDLLFVNKNGILCVKYPPQQRPLHERPCMIVMPQLYQHEILFRAHDAMGHQGIAKVVSRIQERHTWPGIRRSVGQYVRQCLTCQQVCDRPGDVRFHSKNIQSGYFNELVLYDHLKICPSENNNTGILVIIDHFSKFAEAVPCSHEDYDAVTTSRLLLQKWFARHGTPTRVLSDNAPNLTAEVSNEFMRASQVTKVTSTAGHPRTQGLVERQNRTLLTLLRVFCSRRMRDWDQHLDEVMGAYNSTRHATIGFSPYMLTRGTEKAIPLTYLYPEFPSRSFESHGAYVEHILARQQEIHDLVRRNTQQAQQRQKLKYDRAIRANAYNVGDPVWVFCRYVPQKGSPKLMRDWRGPHKVVHVLQDGRVYILDSGQKVHFEQLKPHHGGPTEFVALPSGSGEVVVVMDPEPEHSAEEIRDDCSQPSYREEEPLSEASDVSLTSRRRHWMDTRLRTRMRAGGSRLHYQQFDYSSSDPERSRSDDLLSDARDHSQAEPPALFEASMPPDEQPWSFEPANDYELPFLSESEVIPEVPQSQDIPVATGEAEVSLAGTSDPMLTNPTLTDVPISFPQLPNGTSKLQNTETRDTELSNTNEPTARNNVPSKRGRGRSRAALSRCSTRATNSPSQNVSVRAQRTPSRRGRPRGRPPRRPRGHTISSRQTAREIDTQPSITSDSDSDAPTAQLTTDVDQGATQVNPHYGLRRNRVPRYRCGTCGLRDCTCVMALNKSPTIPLGSVKAPVDPKPQPFIHNGKLLVSRVVIRAEKTYTGLERESIFPVDVVLEELSKSKIAEEPCPRFKEWTSDLRGLEFTLAVTVLLSLLTLYLDLSIMRGNPSKWSAVSPLTSYLTNTASPVSLVKCIAQPNIGGCL